MREKTDSKVRREDCRRAPPALLFLEKTARGLEKVPLGGRKKKGENRGKSLEKL